MQEITGWLLGQNVRKILLNYMSKNVQIQSLLIFRICNQTIALPLGHPIFSHRHCYRVFTARRYASAVCAMGLCLSVCLSVTSRCSTKTAKLRIKQTTPLDSPGTLVFCRQKSPRNSTGVKPCGGAKCRCGGLKSSTFDNQLAISRKQYKIGAQFVLKSNRKSYALYRTVTLPMTLNDP